MKSTRLTKRPVADEQKAPRETTEPAAVARAYEGSLQVPSWRRLPPGRRGCHVPRLADRSPQRPALRQSTPRSRGSQPAAPQGADLGGARLPAPTCRWARLGDALAHSRRVRATGGDE